MTEAKRPLKVFLCHARADTTLWHKPDTVRALYTRLTNDGVDAWLDKANLLPGQDWELEIKKAVRAADVVVVCLSKQFNQAGFRQKEVRLALDTAMEKPEGEIFIIPARLEECENLESLRHLHWVDMYDDSGYEKLTQALSLRAQSVDAFFRTELILKVETNKFTFAGQVAKLSNLGSALTESGDIQGAMAYYSQALLLSIQMGDIKAQAIILSNMASVSEQIGDLVAATEYLQRAQKLAVEIGTKL